MGEDYGSRQEKIFVDNHLSHVYLAGYANEDGNPHMHHTIETPCKNINARALARAHTGSGFIDVVGIDIVGAFTNGMEGSLTPYGFVCCDGAQGGAVASPVTLATWRMMLCECVG